LGEGRDGGGPIIQHDLYRAPLTLGSALGLRGPQVISAYGAGGKTTILNRLAAELAASGQKAILTTTTKIYPPAGIPLVLADDPARAAEALCRALQATRIVSLGRQLLSDGKLEGVDPGWMELLWQETGASLLVEADGAAGKPVKGYNENEPVLPGSSHLIIAVTGLDALGARLSPQEVHRPELLAGSAGARLNSALTAAQLARHLHYMLRRGRSQASAARAVAVFNKMDLAGHPGGAARELAALMKGTAVDRLLFTAAAERAPVYFCYRPEGEAFKPAVAAVVLAAGGATRMGADKLQLEYRGRTILEHTLDQICKAGLQQVIVVTRPGSPWRQRLAGYECSIVENPDSDSGIASSLKTGLMAVDGAAQAVCFALGDQPLIPAEVYHRLAEEHRQDLPLATVPLWKGRRGNPVLFDRRTWPLLLTLKGDRGGSQALPQLPPDQIKYVELSCPEIIFDVDTPADYRKLGSVP